MPNLYIADDGTIHDRDVGNCQRVVEGGNGGRTVGYTPAASGGRKFLFWVITLAVAAAIGYAMYNNIGIHLLEAVADPNNPPQRILNFFCTLAPYMLIGGAVVAAILYGKNGAARKNYHLGTYFVSALCAVGGTVAAFVGIYLLSLLASVLLCILAVVFAFALITASLEG